MDTDLGAKDLLNNHMAYVSVSRGAYDAQIFTNDAAALGLALSHDVSRTTALQPALMARQIGRSSMLLRILSRSA